MIEVNSHSNSRDIGIKIHTLGSGYSEDGAFRMIPEVWWVMKSDPILERGGQAPKNVIKYAS